MVEAEQGVAEAGGKGAMFGRIEMGKGGQSGGDGNCQGQQAALEHFCLVIELAGEQ